MCYFVGVIVNLVEILMKLIMFCNDCVWYIEIFYVRICFGFFIVLIFLFEVF